MHGTTRCTVHAISCSRTQIVIRRNGAARRTRSAILDRPSDSPLREESEPHRECPSRRSARPAAGAHSPRRAPAAPASRRAAEDPRPAGARRQRERIAADVAAAEERIARRRAAVPAISYPEDLPVSARRDDIAAALRDNQVVVVAGETGLGEDHAAAQDRPRAGPRGAGPDRAHPAAPHRRPQRGRADRRGAGHPAGRGRRLQDAVHRPGQRLDRWSS